LTLFFRHLHKRGWLQVPCTNTNNFSPTFQAVCPDLTTRTRIVGEWLIVCCPPEWECRLMIYACQQYLECVQCSYCFVQGQLQVILFSPPSFHSHPPSWPLPFVPLQGNAPSLLSHAPSTLSLRPFVSPSPVCIIADPFQVLCLTLTYLFSDCHLLISRPTVLHACCVHKIIRHQVFLGAFLLLQCPTTTSFPLLPSATAFFQVFHSFLGFVPLPSLSRHLTMTIV